MCVVFVVFPSFDRDNRYHGSAALPRWNDLLTRPDEAGKGKGKTKDKEGRAKGKGKKVRSNRVRLEQ